MKLNEQMRRDLSAGLDAMIADYPDLKMLCVKYRAAVEAEKGDITEMMAELAFLSNEI